VATDLSFSRPPRDGRGVLAGAHSALLKDGPAGLLTQRARAGAVVPRTYRTLSGTSPITSRVSKVDVRTPLGLYRAGHGQGTPSVVTAAQAGQASPNARASL